MYSMRKAPIKGLLYILVLSLLTVFMLAPTQGIADGNGGLPVGGLGSVDTLPPQPAPSVPSDPESAISLLTLLWIVTTSILL